MTFLLLLGVDRAWVARAFREPRSSTYACLFAADILWALGLVSRLDPVAYTALGSAIVSCWQGRDSG